MLNYIWVNLQNSPHSAFVTLFLYRKRSRSWLQKQFIQTYYLKQSHIQKYNFILSKCLCRCHSDISVCLLCWKGHKHSCKFCVLTVASSAAPEPMMLPTNLGSSECEPKDRKAAPISTAAEEVLWQYLVGKGCKQSTKYLLFMVLLQSKHWQPWKREKKRQGFNSKMWQFMWQPKSCSFLDTTLET